MLICRLSKLIQVNTNYLVKNKQNLPIKVSIQFQSDLQISGVLPKYLSMGSSRFVQVRAYRF